MLSPPTGKKMDVLWLASESAREGDAGTSSLRDTGVEAQ